MPTKINWKKGAFSKKGPAKKFQRTIVKGVKKLFKGSGKR